MSEAPPRDAADDVAVARVEACPDAGRDPRGRGSPTTPGQAQSRATEAALQELDSTLQRWSARVREGARGGAFRLWPQLAAAGLAIEARGLGEPSIPRLFARDLVRIAPTLNDDLLELYGRSEQVLANRFGFFGETEEFGPEINWAPTRGRAWQVELHSFDYALDLALTHKISGDERYARHLRYLLADWIASNPPGGTIGWTPLALARRIRNSILAADLCRDAFEADADFLKVITSSLAQQVVYLAWQARAIEDRRVRLAASRALLVASRAFAGGRSESLGEMARALLAEALAEGPASFPDHPQPLRQFELAAACCDHVLFGNTDAQWARDSLHGALDRLEGMLHPDGSLPLFGREPMPPVDAVTTLFALGAAVLAVPRWKSLAGDEFGIFPYMILGEAGKQQFGDLPREPWNADSRLESESGIYRLSDGESSAMLITGQPHASPHDHRDWLSYELTVRGQRTVIDSGVAVPADGSGGDVLAAAIHHNVLLVDGRSPEIESLRGVRAVPVEGHCGIDGLWLSRALSDGQPPRWAEKSCVPPLLHQRGFFLLARRFWVVLDHLTGPGANQVESLIHFYPVFSLEVEDGWALAKSGAASVTIWPVAADEVGTVHDAKLRTDREGWYAPAPGTRYPSQSLTLEWKQVRLPAIFGYVIDTKWAGADLGCALSVSRARVRLTLNGAEFSVKIPGGLHSDSGE